MGYIDTLPHARVVEYISHVGTKWLLLRQTPCVPAKFPPVAVILNQRDRAVLESPLGELHFGRKVALDSPRRLRELSLRAEHGDPGRWVLESQREHEWRRGYHQFCPWHLVGIFRIRAPLRKEWLDALPLWWFNDFEVPGAFPVVLGPALTYLQGRLMTNSPDAWCALRTSWVARVIGRWVTDIILRGIMWRLTTPLMECARTLGLIHFVEGSSVSVGELAGWIRLHELYDWDRHQHQVLDDRSVVRRDASIVEMSENLDGIRLDCFRIPSWMDIDPQRFAVPRQSAARDNAVFPHFGSNIHAMVAVGVFLVPLPELVVPGGSYDGPGGGGFSPQRPFCGPALTPATPHPGTPRPGSPLRPGTPSRSCSRLRPASAHAVGYLGDSATHEEEAQKEAASLEEEILVTLSDLEDLSAYSSLPSGLLARFRCMRASAGRLCRLLESEPPTYKRRR